MKRKYVNWEKSKINCDGIFLYEHYISSHYRFNVDRNKNEGLPYAYIFKTTLK